MTGNIGTITFSFRTGSSYTVDVHTPNGYVTQNTKNSQDSSVTLSSVSSSRKSWADNTNKINYSFTYSVRH